MSSSTIHNSTSNQNTNHQVTGSNPAAAQLNKLQQILFTRDTAVTFSQSLRLLLTLVKESLVLLWLGLCYGFVAFGWLGNKVVQMAQATKSRLTTLQETSREQSVTEIAAETGKTVLTSSKATIDYMMTQAKKQVGLLDESNQ